MSTLPSLTDNERWYLALTSLWAARPPATFATAEASDRARADVAFAAQVLHLAAGARVLDLACAWGRTTLELARQGYHVTGFDLSPELLTIARRLATEAGLTIPFLHGTVRCLPPLGPFDAVTAFYDDSVLSFEDEADNLAALAGVARILRPGGAFLFGTTDCPLLLPPSQASERIEGGERITEAIMFDIATRTGLSVRTHHGPDGAAAAFHRVRHHYAVDEAAALIHRAGLTLRRAWCAYDHRLPYGSRPAGMVLLAVKPSFPPAT